MVERPKQHYPQFASEKMGTEQELHHVPDLDITIVFGQGPVKPVMLESELTDEQRKSWSVFKADPLLKPEPDFHVLEGEMFLSQLDEIDARENLDQGAKSQLKAGVRSEWQHMGRFALTLRCRQIALAAGAALISGKTKEVVLTGGTTIPGWKRKELEELFLDSDPEAISLPKNAYDTKLDQFIKYAAKWPSEAELMADVIQRNFAGSYKAKFGKDIDAVLRIEGDATNTLENIALSINKNPDLIKKKKKIGILAFDPHVQRAAKIASMYGILLDENGELAAQQELIERAKSHHKVLYEDALKTMVDSEYNPLIKEFEVNEDRLIRGLTETPFLAYWIGYTFGLDDPNLINQIMLPLLHDKAKLNAVGEVFKRVGQDIDEYQHTDLVKLAQENPEEYIQLRHKLMSLNKPDLRPILPSRDAMETWDPANIL